MVPLAPSHRNGVGIGLWYFETGCGELQLGKNRICDGVVISAPPLSISILGGGRFSLPNRKPGIPVVQIAVAQTP